VATDATGAFALTVPPSAALAGAAKTTIGFVNLDLVAASGDRVARHYFTRAYTDEARAMASDGELGGTLDLRLPLTHAGPQNCNGSYGEVEELKLLKRDDKVPTIVGELHTPPDTLSAAFEYGEQADSTMSVGYRYQGKNWGAGGEHRSETGTKRQAGKRGIGSNFHRILLQPFAYGHYRATCYNPARSEVTRYDVTRVIEWQPGDDDAPAANPGCPADPRDPRVASFGRRGFFDTKAERATTYEGGANAFGFSFSARSGYSKYVHMVWEFGDAPQHLLCGVTQQPLKVPEPIFAAR
jgi:hypothetical protein